MGALFGADGEQELNAVVSGPLSDSLRGRLSYRDYEYDGYLTNILTKKDGPERDDETIRAQLEWDVSDNLTVNAKWESSTYEQFQQSTQLNVVNPFTPGAAAVSGLNGALIATATGGNGVVALDDERAVDNDGGRLLGQIVPGFAGLPGFPDKPEQSVNNSDVGSITLDWQIGEHSLTAITGFAQYDFTDNCDCDFSVLPLIQVDAAEDYEQFSQEIRLTSATGGSFEYIVGAYYQDADLDYRSVEGFGTALLAPPTLPVILFPNLTRDYTMIQSSKTKAVFGSLTWNASDRTRATFGLRYSEEDKKVNHFLDASFTAGWDFSALAGLPAGTLAFGSSPAEYDRFLATPGLETAAFIANNVILADALGTNEHNIKRERKEDFITWSIGLEHDIGDDTLAYGTISTGVKGGGFDARFLGTNTAPFFEYEEEEVLNFELGFKSTLLDGNLTLNGNAFFATVEDYQVSIFDGATAFFVQNAAEVESKGIEVDLKWLATEKLLVGFSGVYLDAVYSKFPNAPCHAGTDANNRGNCIGRGTPSAFRNASGQPNLFSPDFAFNLNLDYRTSISDNLEIRAVANVNYSDSYSVAADLDPIYGFQPSFTMVDLRLSLGSIDGNWDIAILGKNLTEEFTSGNNNDQPLVPGNGFASTSRLRSVAVQANYRF